MKKFISFFLAIILFTFASVAEESITSLIYQVQVEIEAIKTVQIVSDAREVMRENELITLRAELSGFDKLNVRYQWECDKKDGNGFIIIEDAISSTYSFPATKETVTYDWRVTVFY